jgi:hypothetical protein
MGNHEFQEKTKDKGEKMTTVFLIIISFILNAVALLAIVILYTRQNRLMNVEKQQKKMLEDMEEVISTYLMEMKEENEQFIRRFDERYKSQADRDTSFINYSKKTTIIEESDGNESESTLESPLSYRKATAIKAYKNDHKKEVTSYDDDLSYLNLAQKEEKSEFEQILMLKKQGYDLSQIAKRLDKGMTEVELIIKFNQNQ